MSALWTSDEIAAATGGNAFGAWSVAGVSIDSRTLQPGELFVALKGPKHDGHDFADVALRRGGALLLQRRYRGLNPTAPMVQVRDTMAALTALGRAARARSAARIVGITGSVGKTGIKDALRHVLEEQAPTHASLASHNNHWGVPLSLSREPRGCHCGIYEMGMNARGEISSLTRLVRPHVALITTVEAAHLGNFASLDEIAAAKGEIFEGLEPEGTAVLNADNRFFGYLKALAEAAGAGRILTFGRASAAHARLLDASLADDGSEVRLDLGGQEFQYRMGAPGRHWVQNSAAVLAVVEALGADVRAAAARLSSYRPPEGRGRRYVLPFGGGSLTVIDEAYNANPASMAAAIALLGQAQGRRIAVLGDMLELGEHSEALHLDLKRSLSEAGVDLVFASGPKMGVLLAALEAERRGAHAATSDALTPLVIEALRPGDTVLVKGSLGSRMQPLVEALLEHAGGMLPARKKD